MKIAIISDIHENFHNLILALQEMEKHNIEQIICLGDLMNSGIAKLLATQAIPVFMIWGNNDGEKVEITLAAKRENSALTVSTKVYDFLAFDNKKIFISHYEDLALPMAKSGEYDSVFYGHTHLIQKEKIGDCWIVNPGEISAGKTKKATFAIYDTSANQIEIIELKDAISLKTPLMEAYFKKHGPKMGLRSKKAMGLMNEKASIIPNTSPVYKILENAVNTAKAVVFTGLPGVGKSLYINQFQVIAKAKGKKVTVIQWDVARKSFETKEIAKHYPIENDEVHNGVKLSVGAWLLDTIKNWLAEHQQGDLLLIEAPLVGHRFIELAKLQSDKVLEDFFKSDAFQMLIPIPSKKVRTKIEADRKKQVAEDAKTWMGAKPSVMLLLWKMICGIANEFGKNIPMEGQPPYDPKVYEFVFGKILQHRHFTPLHINEIYKVNFENEADLHNTGSIAASEKVANEYAAALRQKYDGMEEIDAIVDRWYLT